MFKKHIFLIYGSLLIFGLQISISESTNNICENGSGCCDINVICQQGSNSRQVICECKKGFTNTGRNGRLTCTDSCQINNGDCPRGTTCTHCSETNVVICKSREGFTSAPNGGTTEFKASCKIDNGGCGENAICSQDKTTNTIVCKCRPGFINVGKKGVTDCRDICSVNNGGCRKWTTCSVSPSTNAVRCNYEPGYYNIGMEPNVIYIDKCLVGNGGCPSNSYCDHDPITNAVICRCRSGFTNVGTEDNVICKMHGPPTMVPMPRHPIMFNAERDHIITDGDNSRDILKGVIFARPCRASLFIRRPYRVTQIFGELYHLFKRELFNACITESYTIHVGKVEGDGNEAKFYYSVEGIPCDAKRREAVKQCLINASKDNRFSGIISLEKQPIESESESQGSD